MRAGDCIVCSPHDAGRLRYRSALAAGEPHAALEELRPLFTRRTGFGLSFEYITADSKVRASSPVYFTRGPEGAVHPQPS